MTLRLVVRAAAEADIAGAALWYEQRSPGLGSEFLRAVDVTLAEIVRRPERFPVVYRDSRRALLRRSMVSTSSPLPTRSASSPACTRAAILAVGRSASVGDR
jgi:hypothetical protein